MRKLRLLSVAAVACMLALVGTTAWAGGTTVGNNGTVKIDGKPYDTAPDNEPHVGCQVRVDFYGFDVAADASATLELQPPSGTAFVISHSTTLKQNDTPGGSTAGYDGQITFQRGELAAALAQAGAVAHPIQGFHLKLTVTTTYSQGADTKYKVFWLQDCLPYPYGS